MRSGKKQAQEDDFAASKRLSYATSTPVGLTTVRPNSTGDDDDDGGGGALTKMMTSLQLVPAAEELPRRVPSIRYPRVQDGSEAVSAPGRGGHKLRTSTSNELSDSPQTLAPSQTEESSSATRPPPQKSEPTPGAVSMCEGQAEQLQKGRFFSAQMCRSLHTLTEYQNEGFADEEQPSEPITALVQSLVNSSPDHQYKDVKKDGGNNYHKKFLVGFVAMVVFVVLGTGVVVAVNSANNDPDRVDTTPGPSLPPESSEPSISPTTMDTRSMISFLEQKSLNPNSFNDITSPEYKASLWLASDPSLESLPHGRILVRYALATLYYSTKGNAWTRQSGWLDHTTHECEWEQDHDDPCTNGDMLWLLKLKDNRLVGALPADLGLLTNFGAIDLSSNQIGGTIPPQLGLLTMMQGLILQSNAFVGSVPTEIANFQHCVHLSLGNNLLTGALPTELGTMTHLTTLSLHYNDFSSPIPTEFGNLLSLQFLRLEDMGLEGEFITEIGNLKSLVSFLVGNNPGFTGGFITELGKLQKLETLDLSSCSLRGSLPSEIGLMASMKQLFISNAGVRSSLPSEIGRMTDLDLLWLDRNYLVSGTIPTDLGRLTRMQDLNVGECRIESTIPSEIGLMSQLTSLKLNGNRLTGTIPAEILSLTNLQIFEHGGNMLET